MATTPKKTVKKKRVTMAGLKTEMRSKGYKLPHGYEVVKRKTKPSKKKK